MTGPSAFLRPRYYELEQFRRRVRRILWAAVFTNALVACGALGIALLALARPIPIVMFDSAGQPVLFEDTVSPRLRLERVRIEGFAQRFLKTFAVIDADNLERTLADAMNLMTPRLREIVVHDAEQLRRRAHYEGSNICQHFAQMETKVAPFDPEDGSVRVRLIAWGEMVERPCKGMVHASEHRTRFFYSQLVLQRVAITQEHLHGLLVDHVETKLFETEQDLRVFSLKRSP